MILNNLIGKKFGRLIVLERSNDKGRRVKWLCSCDCGGTKEVVSDQLMSGKTKSCGCLKKEAIASVNFSHGMAKSREYKSWSHAKARCNNPNDAKYPLYGARGISMCSEWESSFERFLTDMGCAPVTATLDRIDVNGNYEPSNCRWATVKQQANNTRANIVVSAFGFTGTLKQTAEHFGVDYKMIHARITRGMCIESAIKMPIKKANQVTFNGFTGSLKEVSEHFGASYGFIRQRISRYGDTLEDALKKTIA